MTEPLIDPEWIQYVGKTDDQIHTMARNAENGPIYVLSSTQQRADQIQQWFEKLRPELIGNTHTHFVVLPEDRI